MASRDEHNARMIATQLEHRLLIELVGALGDIDRRLTRLEESQRVGFTGFGEHMEKMNETVRALVRTLSGNDVAPILELHKKEEDEDGE